MLAVIGCSVIFNFTSGNEHNILSLFVIGVTGFTCPTTNMPATQQCTATLSCQTAGLICVDGVSCCPNPFSGWKCFRLKFNYSYSFVLNLHKKWLMMKQTQHSEIDE